MKFIDDSDKGLNPYVPGREQQNKRRASGAKRPRKVADGSFIVGYGQWHLNSVLVEANRLAQHGECRSLVRNGVPVSKEGVAILASEGVHTK